MSNEKTVSKRKASTKDARPAKKTKTVVQTEDVPVNQKMKAASEAKKTRKRVADLIQEEEVSVEAVEDSPEVKKVKISKKVEILAPATKSSSESKSKEKKKTEKTSKKSKQDKEAQAVVVAAPEETIALPNDDEDEEDVAALLAGFSEDEDEAEADESGIPVDTLPNANIDSTSRKTLDKAKKKPKQAEEPGTLCISRIPHGFYEPQMRAYFSQFGDITNLRLSRNRKTGASKSYAFIEFSSAEVADIVARAMNNYLMFGHILKVRVMPAEQIHPNLWVGSNKRFKVIPRAKIMDRELRSAKGREYWRGKTEKERGKRERKMEKLREMGYEFEGAELRNVDDVPMKDVVEDEAEAGDVATEDGAVKEPEEAPKALTEAPAEVDPVQAGVDDIITEAKKVKAKEPKKDKVKAKSKKAKA